MSIGDFLESLSRAMLVGTMLVGRLGVVNQTRPGAAQFEWSPQSTSLGNAPSPPTNIVDFRGLDSSIILI